MYGFRTVAYFAPQIKGRRQGDQKLFRTDIFLYNGEGEKEPLPVPLTVPLALPFSDL